MQKGVGKVRKFLQLLRPLLFLLVVGIAGPAWAGLTTVEWTNQADFESNAHSTGRETTRINIDTASRPGDVVIGLAKEMLDTSVVAYHGGKTYSIGAGRSSVAVIDTATGTKRILSLTGQPAGLVYNSKNNKIYVGKYDSNEVWVLDPEAADPSHPLLNSITVDSGAYPIAYDVVHDKVYVANMTAKSVSIIDSVNDVLLTSVPVIAGPYSAQASGEKLYITNKFNNSVSVIDLESNAVTTYEIEPSVAILEGLEVNFPSASDRMHLKWNYDPLLADHKIEFQIRTAEDGEYRGPGGTEDWYDISTTGAETAAEEDGTATSRVILKDLEYAPFLQIRVRLSSDGSVSPVLHSVSLLYESYIDLAIDNAAVPASGFTGRLVDVTSTVFNHGTLPAGSFQVTNTLIDGDGFRHPLSGCDRTVPSLGAKTGDTAASSCLVPSGAAPGLSFVEVCADTANAVIEGIESNNCRLSDGINLIRPYADLRPLSAAVDPAQAKSLAPLSVTSTIANLGNEDAGSFFVAVTLIDGAANRSALCSSGVGSLEDGVQVVTSCTGSAPSAAGVYAVEVCADSTGSVNEGLNETNNCVILGNVEVIKPDLVMMEPVAPLELAIGSPIPVTDTVNNIGKDPAGSFSISYSLVNGENQKTPLGTREVASLAPGQGDTAASTFPMPGVPEGTYRIEACADSLNSVDESNETNNCAISAAFPVRIYYTPGQNIIISKNYGGTSGNDDSDSPVISGNGRYVAFLSRATNLVSSDTNGAKDIFLHDRQTGGLQALKIGVDANLQPVQGNDDNRAPSISSDGQLLAFYSSATNLDPAYPKPGVFLHNRADSTTKLVSKAPDGTAPDGGRTGGVSISGDGKYVLYYSNSHNMLGFANSGVYPDQVFLYDVVNDTTQMITGVSSTEMGNKESFSSGISYDGRYIVFVSLASNLVPDDTNGVEDVFLYDRETNGIERISGAPDGTQANARSLSARISDDGKYVYFNSHASNLVPNDNNGTTDAFLYDVTNKTLRLLSKSLSGGTGNATSQATSISGNGRYVTLYTLASDLIPSDTDGTYENLIYDTQTDRLEIGSFCLDGSQANCGGWNDFPVISSDGSIIAFTANKWDTGATDPSFRQQVFLQTRKVAEKDPLFTASVASVYGQPATGAPIKVPRGAKVTITAADAASSGGFIYNWQTSDGGTIASGKSTSYYFNNVGSWTVGLNVINHAMAQASTNQSVNAIESFIMGPITTDATGTSTIPGTIEFTYTKVYVSWGDGYNTYYYDADGSVTYTRKFNRTSTYAVADIDPDTPGDQPGYKYNATFRVMNGPVTVGLSYYTIYVP